jgi:D-3-phosphoglycerate dehydrogenase / 2-oxoglutarate reductase
MSKPVVLLYEPIHEKALALLKAKAEVRMAASLDPAWLLSAVGDVDGIIIRANGKVTRELMAAAPRLKVVARHGVGVEAIDRQAAAERGIVVVNTPFANDESVAEQCMGMIVALAKRMMEADQAIRAGDWDSRYRLIGIEVQGKTLGLVGFGKIGQRLAHMAHFGFDMPIVYHDVVAYPEQEERLGARRMPLPDLLTQSDFVSLHTPLLPETKGMINEAALRSMKRSAYLINSARGPVVDHAALVQALREGWIAGAGLDVYDPEPLPKDSPLLSMDNVVLSPHMAAHTDEALLRMAMVVTDVLAVIERRPPDYPVPPPR